MKQHSKPKWKLLQTKEKQRNNPFLLVISMKKSTYDRLMKFREDRDWAQFHTGENLAKSICIEASELLEVFQWNKEEKSIDKVKEELADVIMYATLMADHYHLDIDEIVNQKLDVNEKKYPADLVRGSSKKYTEYRNK